MAFVHRASLIAAFGILFEPINKTIKKHKRVVKKNKRKIKNHNNRNISKRNMQRKKATTHNNNKKAWKKLKRVTNSICCFVASLLSLIF